MPSGASPGEGACRSNSNGPSRASAGPSDCSSLLPVRGAQAEFGATLEEKRELVDRALGYVELYGAYAECEAVYGLDRLLALWDSLDDDDRATYPFDPRAIEWDSYVHDIHLPSIVAQARVKTTPGARQAQPRSDRLRAQVLSPDRHLAAFDLENTLIASNVVASYSWLATRRLSRDDRARFVAKQMLEGPSLLKLDRLDRSDFLRFFYRRYEGAPVDQIDEDAAEMFSDLILTKSFPAAIRRVREHRRLGHRTLLITGALDFVVKPLAPLFDDIVAARMGTTADMRHGLSYDGRLTYVPPTGEARYQALVDYADAHGLSLSESVAYADSASDLPDARGRRLPGRRQSRDQAGHHRPQARLAHRRLPQVGRRAAQADADRADARPSRRSPHRPAVQRA